MAERDYFRATGTQIEFWELTDAMPPELRGAWESAANQMGRKRAVRLILDTMKYSREKEGVKNG